MSKLTFLIFLILISCKPARTRSDPPKSLKDEYSALTTTASTYITNDTLMYIDYIDKSERNYILSLKNIRKLNIIAEKHGSYIVFTRDFEILQNELNEYLFKFKGDSLKVVHQETDKPVKIPGF